MYERSVTDKLLLRLKEPRRFIQALAGVRKLLVGREGIPLEDFLLRPAIRFFE